MSLISRERNHLSIYITEPRLSGLESSIISRDSNVTVKSQATDRYQVPDASGNKQLAQVSYNGNQRLSVQRKAAKNDVASRTIAPIAKLANMLS